MFVCYGSTHISGWEHQLLLHHWKASCQQGRRHVHSGHLEGGSAGRPISGDGSHPRCLHYHCEWVGLIVKPNCREPC